MFPLRSLFWQKFTFSLLYVFLTVQTSFSSARARYKVRSMVCLQMLFQVVGIYLLQNIYFISVFLNQYSEWLRLKLIVFKNDIQLFTFAKVKYFLKTRTRNFLDVLHDAFNSVRNVYATTHVLGTICRYMKTN